MTKSTETKAALYMQELAEANQELTVLLDELHELCLHPHNNNISPKQYVDMLNRLRAQLALCFSLEEIYVSYLDAFEEADANVPHFDDRARTLMATHRTLYLEICRIVDSAVKLFCNGEVATVFKRTAFRFENFYGNIQNCEILEREFVPQMLDDDFDA